MGGGESKAEKRIFNDTEQTYVKKHYDLLVNQKPLRFIPATLSNRIFEHLKHSHKEKVKGHVAFSHSTFELFLERTARGTVTDKSNILFHLSSPKDDTVNAQNLYQTVYEFVLGFQKIIKDLPQWKYWQTTDYKEQGTERFVLSLFFELYTKGISKKLAVPTLCVPKDTCFTVIDIEEWLTKTSMMIWILDVVFLNTFCLDEENARKDVLHSSVHVPVITKSKTLPISTILDRNALVYLNNYNLPKHLTSEWRLLFCNSLNGDSFSQLVGHIVNKGPSIIIVKDKDGYIFGGYSSQGWELGPKFYGSADCFLFTITPQYGVYTTTGYNDNFMYLNQGQETLPNGLGMGGQFNYFGFWIDHSFNHGHSKAGPRCTTYGSPQLSKSADFTVEMVEVWAVGPEPKSEDSDDEDKEKKQKSVLQDTESKAMLEILGKHQHSEGYKEREEEEDMSEEMKKKMNAIPKML
ncbi:unnamed protein product [Mytilus edulis]|uniref:MTOR-associated protein MEAK7 n=1 Tax=Mytilus edulis TaxID=6550 RepID=A0A8S3QRC8_MYTED|nr:unnamed protein product [Mytilus edulis]